MKEACAVGCLGYTVGRPRASHSLGLQWECRLARRLAGCSFSTDAFCLVQRKARILRGRLPWHQVVGHATTWPWMHPYRNGALALD